MFLLALLSIPLFTGCASLAKLLEDDVPSHTVTEQFSVNVAYVNEGWPSDPTKLPMVQQELLRTMGTPDMMHLWWDRSRPISTIGEVYHYKTARMSKFDPIKVTWIYLDQKKEVIFKKDGTYEAVPLSDKIRVLCEAGDPNTVKAFMHDGKPGESWIYYGLGRIYRFSEDTLIGLEQTTPVPAYGRN